MNYIFCMPVSVCVWYRSNILDICNSNLYENRSGALLSFCENTADIFDPE